MTGRRWAVAGVGLTMFAWACGGIVAAPSDASSVEEDANADDASIVADEGPVVSTDVVSPDLDAIADDASSESKDGQQVELDAYVDALLDAGRLDTGDLDTGVASIDSGIADSGSTILDANFPDTSAPIECVDGGIPKPYLKELYEPVRPCGCVAMNGGARSAGNFVAPASWGSMSMESYSSRGGRNTSPGGPARLPSATGTRLATGTFEVTFTYGGGATTNPGPNRPNVSDAAAPPMMDGCPISPYLGCLVRWDATSANAFRCMYQFGGATLKTPVVADLVRIGSADAYSYVIEVILPKGYVYRTNPVSEATAALWYQTPHRSGPYPTYFEFYSYSGYNSMADFLPLFMGLSWTPIQQWNYGEQRIDVHALDASLTTLEIDIGFANQQSPTVGSATPEGLYAPQTNGFSISGRGTLHPVP